MKKLNYLILLLVTVLVASCSKSSDNTPSAVQTSFEGKLTTANSVFQSTSTEVSGYYKIDHFTDNGGLISFDHYYSVYNGARSYAGFFYTNSTDNTTANSFAPICGKAKVGTTYLGVYGSSYTPAKMTIKTPASYAFNGCWIANSTYAYNGMTKGDAVARKFKSGDSYTVTATGYDNAGKEIGHTTIYMAKYTSDSSLPEKDWVWFDLTPLKSAVSIIFAASSTDAGDWGMNTSANFCIDGVMLDPK